MSSVPSNSTVENYFDYFSEIEEWFQRHRGTPTLLSTLDWALIESWKEAGIPIEAVRLGMERAFQKYARRPKPFRKINSLAYCTQAVLEAADELKTTGISDLRRASPAGGPAVLSAAPFSAEELRAYFRRNADLLGEGRQRCETAAEQVLAQDLEEVATALRRLAQSMPEAPENVRELELELATLEEKLSASVVRACPVERLTGLRREVDRGIAPYRGKMTAPQLESLERQFLKRSLFEHYGIPRLSLFYCPASKSG
jgi:hypothetical protein